MATHTHSPSLSASKKHEAPCWFFVPALKSVGVACVAYPRLIASYVSTTRFQFSAPWIPTATRSHMCCGRSTISPSAPRIR